MASGVQGSPHTQPNLLFVATQKKEREREREKREGEQSFKVINPVIIPVINNLRLVGY